MITATVVYRGVARIFSEERTIFQIAGEQLPPPSPFKTVATRGHSQTEFHDRRGMVCPLRSSSTRERNETQNEMM